MMTEVKKPVDIFQTANDAGEFKRKASVFRDVISSEPGSRFPPEANRYHLYASYGCPWATRTLIVRRMKGLTSIIGASIVQWQMDKDGWKFVSKDDPCEGATVDLVYGFKRIKELYFKADADYNGRFTVPVLWDTKEGTIVNNESSEIIRMFNSEFNEFLPEKFAETDFYPAESRLKIDEINDLVYENINNGVYKTGFATKQDIYEKECRNVFNHLDKIERILAQHKAQNERYLVDGVLTEADIRLYVTIIRFDVIYVQHHKCNIGMIRYDYPAIHEWLQHLYWQVPGFQQETNFNHIKLGYTKSHPQINPHGITPLGPIPDILPL